MTTYLIPFRFTCGKNPITIEYHIINFKKDMRRKFCKVNQNYEIDQADLDDLLTWFKDDIILKDNRVIMRNGIGAHTFAKVFRKVTNHE